MSIALVISDLKEECLTALSKQLSFFLAYKSKIWNYALNEANQNSEFLNWEGAFIHPSSAFLHAHVSSSSNSIKTPNSNVKGDHVETDESCDCKSGL